MLCVMHGWIAEFERGRIDARPIGLFFSTSPVSNFAASCDMSLLYHGILGCLPLNAQLDSQLDFLDMQEQRMCTTRALHGT